MVKLSVGLTGGIASGKSAVAQRLARLGAVIIDSDLLAREAVAPGTVGLSAVVSRFGEGVLGADGALNRAALARIVFADPEARKDLEAIIHPAVRREAARLAAAASADAVVVQVIPLLVETGQADGFDVVVVVDVDPEVQLRRLQSRDDLGEPEAVARVASQASRDQRLAAADVVIGNSGSMADLSAGVDQLWAQLGRLARQ